MTEEFNLSEEKMILDTDTEEKECPECCMPDGVYFKKDKVKKFIKLLKENVELANNQIYREWLLTVIDKLAGSELTDTKTNEELGK